MSAIFQWVCLLSYLNVYVLNTDLATYQVVIADESHFMKNAQAKRTVACVPVIQVRLSCLLNTVYSHPGNFYGKFIYRGLTRVKRS